MTINVIAQKWHLAYFGQMFRNMNFKFVLPSFTLSLIYKPSLKSIGPKLAILSPKNSPYLKTPFCPSVIHQKAYSSYIFQLNLSECVRINVNMDFTHTNHDRFFI